MNKQERDKIRAELLMNIPDMPELDSIDNCHSLIETLLDDLDKTEQDLLTAQNQSEENYLKLKEAEEVLEYYSRCQAVYCPEETDQNNVPWDDNGAKARKYFEGE